MTDHTVAKCTAGSSSPRLVMKTMPAARLVSPTNGITISGIAIAKLKKIAANVPG